MRIWFPPSKLVRQILGWLSQKNCIHISRLHEFIPPVTFFPIKPFINNFVDTFSTNFLAVHASEAPGSALSHWATKMEFYKYTNPASGNISVVSQSYFRHISCIFRHISDISLPYLRPISAISLAYLKCISDICQTYLRHIKNISQGYFRHISDISMPFLRQILEISRMYLRHI